ncbi:hypothetical protein BCON_0405g00030 [Botryotinia convoluta]|uniref:Uncharacterized protein n=1 Tax=Botryotinia convoluta TaxID=54673 RepID=A0A4Z1H865_9HELO|nr:hypothetical protein BCON_0405g00030 [Botryotinia convoluta]
MSLPLSDRKNVDTYEENCWIDDFLELEDSERKDEALFEKDIEYSEENNSLIVGQEEDAPIQKEQSNSAVTPNSSKVSGVQEAGRETAIDSAEVV